MTRASSQNDRILELLADRRPHRVPDIHQAVGTCRLNSRIAELRKRLRAEGLTIVCRHLPGLTGAEAYEYELTTLDERGAVGQDAVSGSARVVREPERVSLSSSGATSTTPEAAAITATSPLQLELLEVA